MLELLLVLIPFGLLLLAFMAVQRMTTKIDKMFYRQQWREIEKTVSSSSDVAHHAVTEADKLLDFALKQLKFRGATMADRLKAAGPSLKNKDAVWSAHKLRNRIVHETDLSKVKVSELKNALASYQRALKDLGAL